MRRRCGYWVLRPRTSRIRDVRPMPHDNTLSQPRPASGLARFVWVGLIVVLLAYFARPSFERWRGTGSDGGAPAAPADAPSTDEKSVAEKTTGAEKPAAAEKTSAAETKTKFAGLKDVGGNVK